MRYAILLALTLLAPSPGMAAQAVAPSYQIGGITADFSSIFMVDAGNVQRSGQAARTRLLQAPRVPPIIGGVPIAYSTLDVVLDCSSGKVATTAFASYGPDDRVVVSSPAESNLALPPAGSALAAAAAVACTGRSRAPGAPVLASRKAAADYGRGLLERARNQGRAPDV